MATADITDPREHAVAAGRSEASGRGLVLAGDRSGSRTAARRHSRLVRIMRLALPAGAIATCALFAVALAQRTGMGASLAELEMPKIIPENLAMENPHYEGFNADGGKYWVRADSAQQDLKALTTIKLIGITGELTDAQKRLTHLKAARGSFDSKANKLELFDSIAVDGDDGLTARLSRATVMTKEGLITSDQPVAVAMSAGKITANQMTIRQKTKEYTFLSEVVTHLNARDVKAPEASPKPGKKQQPGFGDSGQPVDVTSNRLDVNDASKTAIFSGQVVASQAGSTLTAPELTVTYEGNAVAPGKAAAPAAAADAGGKVKRIQATNPVTMRQANGDTVTSRSADFDAVERKAVLEGDVVMTQAPDKRAVGDRVEFDQTADTVLLTGPVVLNQGTNELRGRRLFYSRATSKMQLTAQGANGASGRVFARFQQQGKGGGAGAAAPGASAAQGIPFGASFKTDPNAPIAIEAERLDVDDASRQAVFTGDVHAIQGEFNIRAAEVSATYTGSSGLGSSEPGKPAAQLNRLQARRNVQITSGEAQKATGDAADFDTKANMATLTGNVVLTQGKSVVRGTKLVIDMNTGQSTLTTEPTRVSGSDGSGNGTVSGSRPSAVFYPNELKGQTSKPAPAAANDGWQARSP